METKMLIACQQLDSIITFLTPLLPITNCHMVEFFTQHHWEKLLPKLLRQTLDGWEFDDAVQKFWKAAEGEKLSDRNCPLTDWVQKSRSNCLAVDSEVCISAQQLRDLIKSWGGEVKQEIRISEFMTSKKSYEVQTMSSLVAALHAATGASCCVDAGGGRGALPAALSLGHRVRSLTVDCDRRALAAGAQRVKVIEKQWHAVAKRIKDGNEERISEAIEKGLHRFASAFITKDTDLCCVVKETYPELCGKDIKLLLTGLHTCGNLGPDCLRIFAGDPSTAAVFNVPCCYHLLTEPADEGLFDVFQRDYGDDSSTLGKVEGFPMSERLRGYNLGRNARMLAAQSIDRVVSSQQLPSRSLLYRALLQVIIEKHSSELAVSEGKLKGLAAKCDNFQEYLKKADAILKLRLFDTLSDSYLTEVCVDLDCQWKKLALFYLLRLCLAQVVESVILLDRFMFLLENGFQNVYLVKLFDPVLSPRCHSIVAVR